MAPNTQMKEKCVPPKRNLILGYCFKEAQDINSVVFSEEDG